MARAAQHEWLVMAGQHVLHQQVWPVHGPTWVWWCQAARQRLCPAANVVKVFRCMCCYFVPGLSSSTALMLVVALAVGTGQWAMA